MSNGTLPFSDTDYDKLNHAVFPTIRRRDKYGDVGDVNTIMHGEKGKRDKLGEAEIIAKETITLNELNNQFFKFDTQETSYKSALDSINKFYRNNIGMDEELTLYWNRWVNHGELL
jgi:hypothetical protein